jgi:hypothetical protein
MDMRWLCWRISFLSGGSRAAVFYGINSILIRGLHRPTRELAVWPDIA